MANFIISAAVQSQLDAVATAAADAFVADRVSWEPVAEAFGEAVEGANIPTITDPDGKVLGADWESEGGKAVIAYISPKILTALAKNKYYDLSVHRVGSGDEYLPVDFSHDANFTITGSFAVTADLNDLASVKERPLGMKAWLRGGANGLRPDGSASGLRDLINNNKDQVVRRLKKKENEKRQAASKKNLVDKLLEVYKFLAKSRDKYEKEGKVCATDAELKTYCGELADKVLKRQPKAKKS
jgi:hypothetical protein